jgi:hypothetical protein
MDALASRGPPTQARHVGLCARFINKYQPFRAEAALETTPFFAGFDDVGAVLFAGSERLF